MEQKSTPEGLWQVLQQIPGMIVIQHTYTNLWSAYVVTRKFSWRHCCCWYIHTDNFSMDNSL